MSTSQTWNWFGHLHWKQASWKRLRICDTGTIDPSRLLWESIRTNISRSWWSWELDSFDRGAGIRWIHIEQDKFWDLLCDWWLTLVITFDFTFTRLRKIGHWWRTWQRKIVYRWKLVKSVTRLFDMEEWNLLKPWLLIRVWTTRREWILVWRRMDRFTY